MWTRKGLKLRAKQVLRANYWKAFLVSLLLAILTGGVPGCSYNGSFGGGGSSREITWSGATDGIGDFWSGSLAVIVVILILVVLIAASIGLAFRFLLVNPLQAGSRKYFVQAAQEDDNLNHLGFSFAKGRYGSIVKGMFWSDFLNMLWYLLFLVPGIVKSYAYSLVPYILADNPRIGMKRAVQLSNRMTRGHKWKIFVLDLSFIGWFLLGTIAFFIGTLFVLPYYNATKAELYLALREQALDEGICGKDELNLN